MAAAKFASLEDFPCLLWIVAVDEGATRTLVFGGEWDLATSDAAHAVDQALDRGPECLVLDLTRVSFIDASAVHELLDVHERCAAKGTRLQIVPARPSVQRVFDLCRVSETLPFVAHDASA